MISVNSVEGVMNGNIDELEFAVCQDINSQRQ